MLLLPRTHVVFLAIDCFNGADAARFAQGHVNIMKCSDIIGNNQAYPWKHGASSVQIEKRKQDELLNTKALKVCTACAMLQCFAMVREGAPNLACPVIAFHGEQDHVCPLDAVRHLFDSVISSQDKTLKTFPDGLHDLEHDAEAPEVHQTMEQWIGKHL